mgnify:CR=1 FL=1
MYRTGITRSVRQLSSRRAGLVCRASSKNLVLLHTVSLLAAVVILYIGLLVPQQHYQPSISFILSRRSQRRIRRKQKKNHNKSRVRSQNRSQNRPRRLNKSLNKDLRKTLKIMSPSRRTQSLNSNLSKRNLNNNLSRRLLSSSPSSLIRSLKRKRLLPQPMLIKLIKM